MTYSIDQSFIYGECTYKQRYDVLSVVMINIPEYGKLYKVNNEPSELHKMLYDIFVEKNSAKEKIEIIKEKYNLISETLERRINYMCNLSEALVEDTRKASVNITKLFMQGKTSEEIEKITDYPLSLIEEVQADLEEVKP